MTVFTRRAGNTAQMVFKALVISGSIFIHSTRAFGIDWSPEEFFAAYEPAVVRLERLYSEGLTMSGDIVRERETPTRDGINVFPEDFTLYTSGTQVRLDIRVGKLPPGMEDLGPKAGTVLVTLVGKDKALLLSRAEESSQYVLGGVGGQLEPSVEKVRARAHGLFASFCDRNGDRIIDFLRRPGVAIHSINQQGSLVTVRFGYRPTAGSQPGTEYRGSFTFMLDQSWAQKSANWGRANEDEDLFTTTVDYGDSIGDVPLLKRAHYSWLMNGKRMTMYQCDVNKIEQVRVPDRDFTMAAFNLPDVKIEARKSYFWIYLNILGIALILVAIGLRKYWSRRTAEDSP